MREHHTLQQKPKPEPVKKETSTQTAAKSTTQGETVVDYNDPRFEEV